MAVYYAGFIPVDGVYAVFFPDFPGCNSEGQTLEEAYSFATEALASYIEAMSLDGDIIPPPMVKAEAELALGRNFAELGLGSLPASTEVHPVLAPGADMRTKQVSVSFPVSHLEMIDRKARAAGMTRSGFLARAAVAYEV